MKTKTFKTGLSMVCLGTLMALPLSSNAITMSLDVGNTGISGYSGPYGTVTVIRTDSTHATITFASGSVDDNIYLFGAESAVAVNVNAAQWTLGSVSGANAGTGFDPGDPYSNGGFQNAVDGWGSFNQTIDSFDGYTHSADSVSFSLQNDSGTWATDADVLTPNADGHLVAAHIFVTESPADAANGALATGFASNGGTSSVPDGGATIALLGFGLAGMSFLRRKLAKS